MSVSLEEVLENAGYDIRNNPKDATWFLSQEDEIDDLIDASEELLDEYDEYKDYVERVGNSLNFEEWRNNR